MTPMLTMNPNRSLAASALAALLAIGPLPSASAAETQPLVEAKPLLDWAERSYPALFPPGSSTTPSGAVDDWYEYVAYLYRHYPATGNYLAVANGMVYGLGPFTGGRLATFGPVSAFHCQALPASCTPAPRPTFNECHSPAAAALSIGWRTEATYRYSGVLVGQAQVSTVVEGPAATGGPAARSVLTVNTGRFTRDGIGYEWDTTTREVRVPTAEGIVFLLAQSSDATERLAASAVTQATQQRTVAQQTFEPGLPETQFTLQPGGFVSQTVKRTEVQSLPMERKPPGGYYHANYRFIGMETVQVGGRAMQACRYEVSKTDDIYDQWVLVGSGLTARLEYRMRRTVGTVELLSATVNGQPL